MANKRYAGIAAARHMSGLPHEAETDTVSGKRAGPAPRPLKAGRQARAGATPTYRKQRLVALVLTTLVCLAVPSLVTLLVLFG